MKKLTTKPFKGKFIGFSKESKFNKKSTKVSNANFLLKEILIYVELIIINIFFPHERISHNRSA